MGVQNCKSSVSESSDSLMYIYKLVKQCFWKKDLSPQTSVAVHMKYIFYIPDQRSAEKRDEEIF